MEKWNGQQHKAKSLPASCYFGWVLSKIRFYTASATRATTCGLAIKNWTYTKAWKALVMPKASLWDKRAPASVFTQPRKRVENPNYL